MSQASIIWLESALRGGSIGVILAGKRKILPGRSTLKNGAVRSDGEGPRPEHLRALFYSLEWSEFEQGKGVPYELLILAWLHVYLVF